MHVHGHARPRIRRTSVLIREHKALLAQHELHGAVLRLTCAIERGSATGCETVEGSSESIERVQTPQVGRACLPAPTALASE